LKAELELTLKENQLIEQTRNTLEASYNDLVKEIRRSRIEEKYTANDTGTGFGRDYYGKSTFGETRTSKLELGSTNRDNMRSRGVLEGPIHVSTRGSDHVDPASTYASK